MNVDETTMCLRALTAAYPRELTPDMIELWHNVFSTGDVDHLLEAIGTWLETEERWPTPAGIRRIMRDQARRRQMDAPHVPAIEPPAEPLPDAIRPANPNRIVGPREGLKIAYRAYCSEVERHGRRPRPFEEFAGKVPVGHEEGRRRRAKW